MKVIVGTRVYDTTKIPVLLVFDENERKMFNGMKRFVSAPENSTVEERQALIDKGDRYE